MWERGLKLNMVILQNVPIMSLPVWERGLKRKGELPKKEVLKVAPRVGAWIETGLTRYLLSRCEVAPRVGAWIETSYEDS